MVIVCYIATCINYIHMHTAVDCGNIEPPANGMVTTAPDTVYLSTATYECDDGYQLSDTSSMTRTCEASGEWSGTEPQCESKMVMLSLQYNKLYLDYFTYCTFFVGY